MMSSRPPVHPLTLHESTSNTISAQSSSASIPGQAAAANNSRRRNIASFFLQTGSATASPASTHSRHNSQSTTSNHSSPSHSRRSSVANLTMTLATYQIPPPVSPTVTDGGNMTETDTIIPDLNEPGPSALPEITFFSPHTPPKLLPSEYKSASSLYLGNIGNDQYGQQRMDAVVEIHRVLYRGKEDLLLRGKTRAWKQQEKAVRRVIERFFEDECAYDHPLLRVTSRQNLISHFALLQLLSTGYMPAVTLRSFVHHAQELPVLRVIHGAVSTFRHCVHGAPGRERDVEAGHGAQKGSATSKPLPHIDEKETESIAPSSVIDTSDPDDEEMTDEERIKEEVKWWKLWDISAECKEIGGMETYEGHHFAMVEHVITLTLLPALVKSRAALQHSLSAFSSTDSFAGHVPGPAENTVPAPAPEQTSFIRKLGVVVAEELDYLLNYNLPIQTIVHFNEVGKATEVRDYLDFRDCVETFVPLAKRFGWFTRSCNGYFTSGVGSLALSLVTPRKVTAQKGPPIPLIITKEKGKKPMDPSLLRASDDFIHRRRSGRNAGVGRHLTSNALAENEQLLAGRPSSYDASAPSTLPRAATNSLGLQGVEEAPP